MNCIDPRLEEALLPQPLRTTSLPSITSSEPLCLPFARSRWAIPLREQHVLWWGGLRGALALALALALPTSFPFNNAIIIATFGVVTFSVVVQGLTMPVLMRRL